MSVNRYQPHVIVLPEDQANSQIANGFLLDLNLNQRTIQILPYAHGWKSVVEQFTKDHIAIMRQYPKMQMVLLIDFDRDSDRLDYIKQHIPQELESRVFILGVWSEPEDIKSQLNQSLERIGAGLADDCATNSNQLWHHDLLQHNAAELARLITTVKPFLFN
jgi:hypothetical protein